MIERSVSETKAQLSALLDMVERGEEVVITRNDRPIAKLIPIAVRLQPRKAGAMKGKIWISPDLEAADPELERLFTDGPIEP